MPFYKKTILTGWSFSLYNVGIMELSFLRLLRILVEKAYVTIIVSLSS